MCALGGSFVTYMYLCAANFESIVIISYIIKITLLIRWIQQKRRKWNNRGRRPILTGGCRQVFSEWRKKKPTKSHVRSVNVQSIVCPDKDCESCDTKAVILFSCLLEWLCIFGSNSKWDLHRRTKYLSFNCASLFTYVW